MTGLISARQAMDRLSGEGEFAFLDLREAGPFSEGHPLFATPCPWSGLEAEVTYLVPRQTVPILLFDGGDGIAAEAALVLARMGYTEVSVIEGGAPAWAQAGFTLFKGVHVPSKALGELAEEELHPKAVKPDELADWLADGREVLFYDCRPASEHHAMTVPGAVCLPNGELPHRLGALPADTPIVVTCAGRTRGIIGAASLGLVAPDRLVYWLEDGTQGWTLSGRDLSYRNAGTALPRLNDSAATASRLRAEALMEAQGIPVVGAAEIAAMRAVADRTTFHFDVRAPEEAASDPIPGFAPAPVVQLIQATDRWMAVRRARVVLADDLGLRGAIAAYWLRALGYDPAVAIVSEDLRALDPDPKPEFAPDRLPRIGAEQALAEVAKGAARFVDVRSSPDYCAGHVAGAVWSIRPRLRSLPDTTARLFLVGDATPRADLAGATLLQQDKREVTVVEGGMPALISAGATVVTAPPMKLEHACDITSFAHGRHEGNSDASRLYLAWEKGLVGQLSDVERASFRI